EIYGLSRDEVKGFLQRRRAELDLEDGDINIIHNQRVKGDTFLDFNAVDFERWEIPGAPAKNLKELGKKRKALEEVKKTWKVNSTLRETDWSSHYFMDPVEGKQQEQASLFKKIEERSFIMLYGTRASGKSTRFVVWVNYRLWRRLLEFIGTNLSIYKRSNEYLESCADINRAEDFLRYFSIAGWENANKNSENLLRDIRNTIESYVIQAIIDSIRNPNFNMEQVRALFSEFEGDNKLNFEQGIIEDIFEQTNGHQGLVCLCGRAIEDNLLRKLNKRLLSREIWECHKVSFLMDAIILDMNVTTDINSAEYLASEGVLVPGEEAGAFKLPSPLVRWLILQRVIPNVFPSRPREEIPFFKDSQDLDTLIALEFTVKSFDKDIISFARFRSFKTAKVLVNGKRNQYVPRESVYDAELCRILRNLLSVANFKVTGQWHLISDKKHRYSDIVIDTPFGEKIVLELFATAVTIELDEHYQRALDYARLLSANETLDSSYYM
ncbi:9965_t:CDS:2, partial [Funneliformis mosseae]